MGSLTLVSVASADTGSVSTGMTAAPTAVTTAEPTLTKTPSAGSSLGEYKSVACTTNSAFAANSCDQCFDGGSLKKDEMVSGLYDNWINPTSSILLAYKEEQKTPNMVALGNTKWSSLPSDESLMWKTDNPEITWVDSGSGGKSQYILPAGNKVKFHQTDLAINGYKLVSTDKKAGDAVGLLRFPIVYRTIDTTTGEESAPKTHYECVAYSLAASATPATPAETPTPEKKPTPAEVTQTQTGPETLLLIVAAFFIAFGLMFSLRKRA